MLSVSTVAWDGHGMEAALDGAAAAGLALVEPAFIRGYVPFDEDAFGDASARALRRAMEARGLGAVAVSAHLDLTADGAADALRRRIGFVAGLGARIVVTNAGPASGEAALRRVLDAVLPAARAAGVAVALENPGHGRGDLIPDAAAGAALLDRIGAGTEVLGLNLDLGNVLTYSDGAVPLDGQVAAAGRHLLHLHLKDVVERDGGWSFVPVGRGAVGYARLLGDVPPGVPVGLEMPLRLRRPGKADPCRAADPAPRAEIDAAVRAAAAFVSARLP